MGNTEPYLYLFQRLPTYDRWFFVKKTLITDGCIKDDELSLSPIAPSSSAPAKASTVAVGFEIYQIGGTINDDKRPSSAVHVFDCRTHTWRDAPNMTVPRKRAKSAFIDGKIFVIGGIEKELSSMNWAEVFDPKTQTWKPLPSPCDDAKVQLCRGKLYVNSDLKSVLGKKFMWYDSERRKWFMVEGLEDLYTKCVIYYRRLRLANYGGKLVILWDLPVQVPEGKMRKCYCQKNKKIIWCAVIKLKKRIGFSGLEIWGEIEQSNAVLTLHSSFKFLSCSTV
ncbi:unnamed protein product [Arabidopsis lyrata]|uniref:putative F-box/kelch-repeat protein At4g35120 n=1 Tax=Arabidopsis lyrata subsp. lyrata TaxID=81972 RepID=UPI000A29AFCE|nr:putative F-box/kelch-repeat protein At4g35120 [Arabidopsis lyrata subsp. lyrata]CAH8264025.1 unnamed protein product [Arabidopsis lyrata]|eukprot:XP_020884691.1 putative F-box/kelch-repeat protein At4g35120 [Arabidopsis lyrata subsp. lyrata]